MIVEVDPADPTPAYEQIRRQIARLAAAGVLAPGTRLPAIRQLANDLGLAKGTVAHAYEALLRDGVVQAAGRRGTVITDSPPPATGTEIATALEEAARAYAVTAHQLGADPHTALTTVRTQLAALHETLPVPRHNSSKGRSSVPGQRASGVRDGTSLS